MFNNPKDVPFAVGMVWAMYYLVRIMAELPRPRGRLVVKFGMATGLALGVRVGGCCCSDISASPCCCSRSGAAGDAAPRCVRRGGLDCGY